MKSEHKLTFRLHAEVDTEEIKPKSEPPEDEDNDMEA